MGAPAAQDLARGCSASSGKDGDAEMQMSGVRRRLLNWAVMSRLLVWLCALLASNAVPSYDSSTAVLARTVQCHQEDCWADKVVDRLFSMHANWDGIHMLQIARGGYLSEQQFAFFPFLPALLGGTAALLQPVTGLGEWSCLLLAGALISQLSFLLAVAGLYRLTYLIFRSERKAYLSTLFFCFSPASIFFNSIYTEGLFACLSFWGFCALADSTQQAWLLPTVFFALAASGCYQHAASWIASRSNGILLVSFICAHSLFDFLTQPCTKKFCIATSKSLVSAIVIVMPSYAFQRYAEYRLCASGVTNLARPYCGSLVPSVYSFVQRRYWHVGLFQYYTPQQLPNFVLAAPVLVLSVLGIGQFMRDLYPAFRFREAFAEASTGRPTQRFNLNVLPFVLHWGMLVLICVAFANVQIATRFLTSCPALYWYCESLYSDGFGMPVVHWSMIYIVLGALMFSSFLPWT
eukprot:g71392.t1